MKEEGSKESREEPLKKSPSRIHDARNILVHKLKGLRVTEHHRTISYMGKNPGRH